MFLFYRCAVCRTLYVVLSARDVIYTFRAYATMSVSVCLSVRLSVTEVHWRIIANLGIKFRYILPRIAAAVLLACGSSRAMPASAIGSLVDVRSCKLQQVARKRRRKCRFRREDASDNFSSTNTSITTASDCCTYAYDSHHERSVANTRVVYRCSCRRVWCVFLRSLNRDGLSGFTSCISEPFTLSGIYTSSWMR